MHDHFDPGLADDVAGVVLGFAVGAHHEGVGTGGEVRSDGVQYVHLRDDAGSTEAGGDAGRAVGTAHRADRGEALIGVDPRVGVVLAPPAAGGGVV